MIRLHFPDATDSPTGKTPLKLRTKLTPRVDGPGAVLTVHFKYVTAALTADALAGYQQAGAWIETDDATDQRRLREAYGNNVDIRLIAAGASA